MIVLEIVLLVLAYTCIIISLFLEWLCFKKKLEKIETIIFTVCLLLLVVALTARYFFATYFIRSTVDGFILLTMIGVGITTPLHILAERNHRVPVFTLPLIFILGIILSIGVGVTFGGIIPISFVEYGVSIYLGLSVVFSMIVMKTTTAKVYVKNQDKLEKYMSTAFLVVIPISLLSSYIVSMQSIAIKIGFTLPLVFIVLAVGRAWENLQRLSFAQPIKEATENVMVKFSLTKREQEVALLLMKGITYKEIAEKLFISVPTVKSHASNIYKKCSVKNKIELISTLSE